VTGDLTPLCDQHHAPMRRSLTIPLKFHGYTGDQLCQRRYRSSNRLLRGVSPTTSYEIYCATHFHHPLYLRAYDAKHGLTQYACPVPGCENSATVVFAPNKKNPGPQKRTGSPAAVTPNASATAGRPWPNTTSHCLALFSALASNESSTRQQARPELPQRPRESRCGADFGDSGDVRGRTV